MTFNIDTVRPVGDGTRSPRTRTMIDMRKERMLLRIQRPVQRAIRALLLVAIVASSTTFASHAWAAASSDARIEELEAKINALTEEIRKQATDDEAASKNAASDARVDAIDEKVDVLAEEMGRLEANLAVPEEATLTSFSGLGPAASKVYQRESGISIGGYGEVLSRSFVNEGTDKQNNDVFDALRAVLYVGYKFNDKWVFNSELEFEHGGTGGGGSVSTEFLTLDYLHRDEVNLRAGLLLMPMGFINEIHEPTAFFGADRPQIEQKILPSTWRENGAGVFGTIADRVQYRAYVVNGFRGKNFSSDGLRGGRQKGSRALSNDFAFVARVDVDAAAGLSVGGSVYTGQSGQDEDFTSSIDDSTRSLPDAQLTIYELHAQYKRHGLSLRALWTQSFLENSAKLSRATDRNFTADPGDESRTFGLVGTSSGIASRMQGFYVEAAYDVLPLLMPETRASLEPYFRFEQYDTQAKVNGAYTRDRSKDVDLYVVGVQIKPIPQVVFKVDYSNFRPQRGSKADQVQVLMGYAF